MRRFLLYFAAACVAAGLAWSTSASAKDFSFAIVSPPFRKSNGDDVLRDALAAGEADTVSFVVVNGLKSPHEQCTDGLYKRRKATLHDTETALFLSLTAADWAECKAENGKSAAIAKLSRVRELFFEDEARESGSTIPLLRQSSTAKFRSFAENVRWEVGKVMFATLNLPSNNNNFVFDAGRNSEFEDRLVANRDWLKRVFAFATRRELEAVVLFTDANPLDRNDSSKRDGFTEIRKELQSLALKFPGKVLLVHNRMRSGSGKINWRGNLGEFAPGDVWTRINVSESNPSLLAPD